MEPTKEASKSDFYIIGSSILRDVRETDIYNGTVKSIPGGHIKDVKKTVMDLKVKPKTIVTLIGGNDLTEESKTVEQVTEDYTMMLSEIKDKFPDSTLVVSGLPPRFPSQETRTKVKDLNESTKKWCIINNVKFIDNEMPFKLRTGDIDASVYITTGATPNIHLNRKGTIRMLENIRNHIPELKLSDAMYQQTPRTMLQEAPNKQKRSAANYAQAVKRQAPDMKRQQYTTRRPMVSSLLEDNTTETHSNCGCFNCGEHNHGIAQCRAADGLRCWRCGIRGHKERFCDWNQTSQ